MFLCTSNAFICCMNSMENNDVNKDVDVSQDNSMKVDKKK